MEKGGYLIAVYVAYAVVAVSLVAWMARTLFKSGAVFLEEVFADNHRVAESVNRLLVVGFYLINLGCASLILKAAPSPTAVAAIEVLSHKLGLLLLSLGAVHCVNMYVLHRIRRRSQLAELPPPVAERMVLEQPMAAARLVARR